MQVSYEEYREMQRLKKDGLRQWQVSEKLKRTRSTIARYWNVSEREFAGMSRKNGALGMGRYRQYIVDLLEEKPDITNKEIYQKLSEQFFDFAVKERETIEYLYELRREEAFPYQEKKRQHVRRLETAPGEEAQVDMGQIELRDIYGHRAKVYIFAMVLSYSRMRFFTLKAVPYDAESFVEAHRLAFKYFGGRTRVIMYDQDRVMVVSENAGKIVFTKQFEEYKNKTGFEVFLCHKHDPNTKGKIENTIRYIKYNFFKDKKYTNIETLNSQALVWLDEVANAKVHNEILQRPKELYIAEKGYLIPVCDDDKPIAYRVAKVDHLNSIRYLNNYYTLPAGRYKEGDKVKIASVDDKIKVYDITTDELIAEHIKLEQRGQTSEFVEKRWSYESLINETLNLLRNTEYAVDFIEHIKTEMPRYIRQQCNMLRKIAKEYTDSQVDDALIWCINSNLYSATNVLAVLASTEGIAKAKPIMPTRSIGYYKSEVAKLAEYDKLYKGGKNGQ